MRWEYFKGTWSDLDAAQLEEMKSRNLTAKRLILFVNVYTRHLSKRRERIVYEEEAKDEKEDAEAEEEEEAARNGADVSRFSSARWRRSFIRPLHPPVRNKFNG